LLADSDSEGEGDEHPAPQADPATRQAIAAAAAALLPTLFGAFTSTAPGEREALQRAIRELARAAEPAVAGKLFEQVW
jgi:hypothetical protein